jgi:hypothetical protein
MIFDRVFIFVCGVLYILQLINFQIWLNKLGMISKITGRLVSLHTDFAIISAEPFEYEVLIPEYTRRQLQNELGKTISLHTIYSFDGNPQGKMMPRLIGFMILVGFCSISTVLLCGLVDFWIIYGMIFVRVFIFVCGVLYNIATY